MTKMPFDAGMDPIQARWRDTMQAEFSRLIDAMPGVGMVLFLFDEHAGKGRLNYIANVKREEAIPAMQEWIDRQELIEEQSIAEQTKVRIDEGWARVIARALKAKLAEDRANGATHWVQKSEIDLWADMRVAAASEDWLTVALSAMVLHIKTRETP